MTPRRADAELLVILLCGLLTGGFVFLLPSAVALRSVFGLPFLLLGQGSAMQAALFGPRPQDAGSRLMTSLALSIAVAILLALGLYLVGIAITPSSVIVGELVVAVAASAVAIGRRSPATGTGGTPWQGRPPWPLAAVVGLAALAVAAAVAVLARPLPDTKIAGYTSLSAIRAADGSLAIRVSSAETSRASYRVLVRTADRPPVDLPMSLSPGGRWTALLRARLPARQPVTVQLFRTGAAAGPYRQVMLRG